MNAYQENKVSMFWAVDAVLDEFETVWQPIPAFVTGVSAFRASLATIDSVNQVRTSDTTGLAVDKMNKRRAMESATLEVAGAVGAYAFDQHDAELQAKMDLNESGLRRLRDSEIKVVCQNVFDTANGIGSVLADYDVAAPVLTNLQAKITAYGDVLGRPAMAKSGKQAAGVSLDDAITGVDDVLDAKLDRLTKRLQTSQPTFFETYNAARSIVNNRGGHSAKPENNGGTAGSGGTAGPN